LETRHFVNRTSDCLRPVEHTTERIAVDRARITPIDDDSILARNRIDSGQARHIAEFSVEGLGAVAGTVLGRTDEDVGERPLGT
jgi:hypothetical protein